MKYKLYRQHDNRDCGAACLATVFACYHWKGSMARIRDQLKIDRNGASLGALVSVARSYGFQAEAYYCEPEELTGLIDGKLLKLPMIAHVVKNQFLHYVVVQKITEKNVVYYDPAGKVQKLKKEEFFEEWTGYIVNFQIVHRINWDKHRNDTESKFWSYVIQERGRIAWMFFLSLFISAISMIDASFYQKVIDNIVMDGLIRVRESIWTLDMVFVFLLFFVFIQGIAGLGKYIVLTKVEVNIGNKLNRQYFQNVFQLPFLFFKNWNTGEIISRFQDMEKIKGFLSQSVLNIIFDFSMLMFGTLILYFVEKRLFCIVLLTAIMYLSVIVLFRKKIEGQHQTLMYNNAKLVTDMKDYIDGAENVKTFCIEQGVCRDLTESADKVNDSIRKSELMVMSESTILNIINGVSTVAILWVGCIQIERQELTLGGLIAFQSLVGYFISPIMDLVQLYADFQAARIAKERLEDLYEVEKECFVSTEKEKSVELSGDIAFCEVSFSYGYQTDILKNVSFVIKQGKHVILKGDSGSGKTTIVNILKGFLHVKEGAVYIGNRNLQEIPVNVLRAQVAYVSQTPYFFGKTIRENLLLDKVDITEQELDKILSGCQLTEMIQKLPFGIDTVLTENAKDLSGGQRQRLSIARALMTCPGILIIDEGTNQIDVQNERRILDFLKEYIPDCTVIRIVHTEIQDDDVDQILTLKEGKVVVQQK